MLRRVLLRSVILRGAAELSVFRTKFESRSGNAVDLDYLSRCRVRGFYDRSSELVAGYVVNTVPPFRYVSFVPEDRRPELTFLYDNFDRFAEGTCVWVDPARIASAHRVQVYLTVVYDFLRTGRKYFLGGTFHHRLMRQQTVLLDNELYHGASGIPGKSEVYLFYGTRFKSIWNIVAYTARQLSGLPSRNPSSFVRSGDQHE